MTMLSSGRAVRPARTLGDTIAYGPKPEPHKIASIPEAEAIELGITLGRLSRLAGHLQNITRKRPALAAIVDRIPLALDEVAVALMADYPEVVEASLRRRWGPGG